MIEKLRMRAHYLCKQCLQIPNFPDFSGRAALFHGCTSCTSDRSRKPTGLVFLPCNIVHFSIFRHPRGAASPPASVHKYRRCFAERAAWAAEIHDQAERDRLVTRKLSCAQWRAKLLWGNLVPAGTQFGGDAWFGNKSISESRFFQHSAMQIHHHVHLFSFVFIEIAVTQQLLNVTHSYCWFRSEFRKSVDFTHGNTMFARWSLGGQGLTWAYQMSFPNKRNSHNKFTLRIGWFS